MDLITKGEVKAVVGLVNKQDLIVISDRKISVEIPIVSTSHEQLQTLKIPSLIQMANVDNNITHPIHCIASILTHFQCLPEVTIFYQSTNDPSLSHLHHRLFGSFLLAGVEVEHHLALSPATNQETLIEQELTRLMNNQRNRVFIITQLSLELVDLLLTKAKKLNMVGNGYTWIISHEVFDLISSLDSSSSSSLLNKMEGVIGLQTYFNDTKKSFKSFETKFKKFYKLEYPQEEEPTKVSIFAIQAYDAAHAITRAMENLRSSDHELMEKILKINFKGVSGIMVRFSKNHNNNNEMLISSQSSPSFKIIKVVDHTYKEVAFWTPKLGFVEKYVRVSKNYYKRSLSEMRVSKSEKSSNGERKLTFVVPRQGACQEFVNVSYYSNGTVQNITGFSVDVFRAVMNNIKDISSYELHPFHHQSYDRMIDAVSNKVTQFLSLL